MKIIVSLIAAVCIVSVAGCAAKATVGNRDQHGAAVAAKTEGPQRGVHAKVY